MMTIRLFITFSLSLSLSPYKCDANYIDEILYGRWSCSTCCCLCNTISITSTLRTTSYNIYLKLYFSSVRKNSKTLLFVFYLKIFFFIFFFVFRLSIYCVNISINFYSKTTMTRIGGGKHRTSNVERPIV